MKVSSFLAYFPLCKKHLDIEPDADLKINKKRQVYR